MKKLMKGVIIVMAFVILVGVSWGKPIKKENVMEENDTSWNWHSDGEFKYPPINDQNCGLMMFLHT